MPDTLVNVLKADICSDADVCDIDPLRVPPDAPIGADVAHLEAVRVLKQWTCRRHRPGGGCIAGGGWTPIERLVRPLMGERFTDVIARPLVCATGGAGRAGGVGVQGAMHAFLAAVLWRLARFDALRQDAQAAPPGGEL
jgi:hypothetical protein